MSIISISKALVATEIPGMLSSTDQRFKDKDNSLSDAIESKWKEALAVPCLRDDANEVQKMEQNIVEAVKHTFAGQIGEDRHLTHGEKIAFEIKAHLFDSLEETITVHSIAERFKVSEKTIESSFRSLFGIRPKRFIKLFKLNHAHADLQLADVQITNVSDIAMKWGFSHFGRSASDHRSLFHVHPSVTLKLKVAV